MNPSLFILAADEETIVGVMSDDTTRTKSSRNTGIGGQRSETTYVKSTPLTIDTSQKGEPFDAHDEIPAQQQ